MMRKSLQIASVAIVGGSLLTIGCSEKKQELATNAKPAEEEKIQEPPSPSKPDPAVAEIDKPRPGIPAALTSKFSKLRGSGPKIPTYIEIRDDLLTGKLAEPRSGSTLEILNRAGGETGVVEILQTGGSLEGFDRESAVGVMALLAGWLIDDENKQNIHLLLGKRADDKAVTNGDALMATLASEAAALTSPGGPLSDSQKREWGNLARARNPVVRQLAAVLLPAVAGYDDQKAFFTNYAAESEFEIIKTVAGKALRLPLDQRRETLTALIDGQTPLGNEESRAYLTSLLDHP